MVELIQMVLDTDLPHGPRLLAIVIANGTNAKDLRAGYWGSIPKLAALCGYKQRTVFRNLRALEKEGLLTIETRSGRSSIYRLDAKAISDRTRAILSPRDNLSGVAASTPVDATVDGAPSTQTAGPEKQSLRRDRNVTRNGNSVTKSTGDIHARTRDGMSLPRDNLSPPPVTNCHPEPEVEPVVETKRNESAFFIPKKIPNQKPHMSRDAQIAWTRQQQLQNQSVEASRESTGWPPESKQRRRATHGKG